MPLYEYRCENGHTFDALQKFSDDPIANCEICGAPAQRVLHPVAIHFKGSGFYSTDYGRGSRKTAGKDSEAGSDASDGSAKTEKPAATTDAKTSDSKSSESKSSE